jgi:hypothetical protein
MEQWNDGYWSVGVMVKGDRNTGMMTDPAIGQCGSNIIPPFQYSIIPDFEFFYES